MVLTDAHVRVTSSSEDVADLESVADKWDSDRAARTHITACYLVADMLAGSVPTCECAVVHARRRRRRPGERCRGLVATWDDLHYAHWDGEH